MPTAHGNTKEVSVEDFLDIFNHRGPNRPVLTFAEIKGEIISRKGLMSEPTVRGKVKPHVYDPDTNPAGFIMKSESDSVSTYWLKGEEMVVVDPHRKTLFELIAMSEKIGPLVLRVSFYYIILSLAVRLTQFLGYLPQDLGLWGGLALHPIFIAWIGGLLWGISLLADYAGKTGLMSIPVSEGLEEEYQAIPWEWGRLKEKIGKQFANAAKLVGIDLGQLIQPRYIVWMVYMVFFTGIGMSINPEGQLIQSSAPGFLLGIVYGVYIVLMGILAAVICSSGVGAFFEAATWLKRDGGVS